MSLVCACVWSVAVKPFISHMPLSTRLLEGGNVKLSCPAWGYPQPNVTWYKGDKSVKPDSRLRLMKDDKQRANRTLAIDGVREDDRAEYKCVAVNRHGNATRAVLLRVTGLRVVYTFRFTPRKAVRPTQPGHPSVGRLNEYRRRFRLSLRKK